MYNQLQPKLKSLATPPKKPEVSRFDKEINSMAEKMRKEAVDKLGYIENEIVNVAKQIMLETITHLKQQEQGHIKTISDHNNNFQSSINSMVSSLSAITRSIEERHFNSVGTLTKQEFGKVERMLGNIKSEIDKAKKDALDEINKSVKTHIKDIDETSKKKTTPVKGVKLTPKKEEIVPQKEAVGGVPEHFVDNVQVDTYKDLENLKRKGDKDNFLIEK